MSRWFRMYDDVLDDPKVQKLPATIFKAWVNLLCLASRNDGILPPIDDIAFALRQDENVTRDIVQDLVQRGLIDVGDEMSPHNWSGRQFKSDNDATSTERKRAQRKREKERENTNVTPIVTDDVTRDSNVTSHPPEQNRAEQKQNTQEACVREADPVHWQEVQALLRDRPDELNDWEDEFLHSIKWAQTLTKAQQEKLGVIRQRLTDKGSPGKPLVQVKRGCPEFDAWISHFRSRGKAGFYESRDVITVPSAFPPKDAAA